MTNDLTLIIGANSEIAKALASAICSEGQLIVISRDISFYQRQPFKSAVCITMPDYSEGAIAEAASQVRDEMKRSVIRRVFVCHGVLHNDACFPERKLEDLSADSFTQIMTSNAITPLLWLKYLVPLVRSKHRCIFTFFSARVGSIGDNHLGGWYSYRASKAALNMLLKSAAIELARRAKNVKLISFHPGTTDSPLSKPFAKNVPPAKLFTPYFVADKLLEIVNNSSMDGKLSYVDWQGKNIPW